MLFFEKLSLTGRCYVLITGLLIANLAAWAAALALFAPKDETRRVLALCAVAWTTGLRHALDADHISAIDNATRQMVNSGKQPITCGLYFSLGHSTIVLAVTIAIAISIDVSNRLNSASVVGGIIGQSVSASFLFLLGCINTFFLYRALKERKQRTSQGNEQAKDQQSHTPMVGCMGRIVRPLLRLIDSPWKLYPIGVLFGLGFDTASEVGLLGVAALAQSQAGNSVPASFIIILPVLFTCGMALVDSLDAILVLWGYVLPNVKGESWKVIFKRSPAESEPLQLGVVTVGNEDQTGLASEIGVRSECELAAVECEVEDEEKQTRSAFEPLAGDKSAAIPAAYSQLSIALTIVSIAVAFAISLIEFMGIALDQCESCSDAADNDSGLAGNWWRFWATMNDNSGYVGAGIVAFMLVLLIGFYLCGRQQKKRQLRL